MLPGICYRMTGEGWRAINRDGSLRSLTKAERGMFMVEQREDYHCSTCTDSGCCEQDNRVRSGWNDLAREIDAMITEAHKIMDEMTGKERGEGSPCKEPGNPSDALSLSLEELASEVGLLVRRLRNLAERF